LEDLVHNWKNPRIKLYLTWKALNFRREHAGLFSKGTFVELEVVGNRNENVAAFARQFQGNWAVAVVPRWLARANYHPESSMGAGFWSNTEIRLPASGPESWHNILTGQALSSGGKRRKSFRLSELLQRFPIALLSGSEISKRSQKKRKSRKK
jgi:(1->4)-alpha-D-glucan 1-alpha-D-glucosylmutase